MLKHKRIRIRRSIWGDREHRRHSMIQSQTAIEWSRNRRVTWPWKVKLVTPIRLEHNISKTTWAIKTSNLVCSFVWGMPSGRTNYFPWKWAWPWPLFRSLFRSCRVPACLHPDNVVEWLEIEQRSQWNLGFGKTLEQCIRINIIHIHTTKTRAIQNKR